MVKKMPVAWRNAENEEDFTFWVNNAKPNFEVFNKHFHMWAEDQRLLDLRPMEPFDVGYEEAIRGQK